MSECVASPSSPSLQSEKKYCYKCGIKLKLGENWNKSNYDRNNCLCKECIRIYNKKYREDNFEKIKLSKREYEINNSEKVNESHRRWKSNNRDKCRESYKKYYYNNLEKEHERKRIYREVYSNKIKERSQKYYVENKIKIAEKNKCYYKTNRDKCLQYSREYNSRDSVKAYRSISIDWIFRRRLSHIRSYRKLRDLKIQNYLKYRKSRELLHEVEYYEPLFQWIEVMV